jgi:hypothetical protein
VGAKDEVSSNLDDIGAEIMLGAAGGNLISSKMYVWIEMCIFVYITVCKVAWEYWMEEKWGKPSWSEGTAWQWALKGRALKVPRADEMLR